MTSPDRVAVSTPQRRVSESSTADIPTAYRAEFAGDFDISSTVTDAAVEDMATMARGVGVLVVKRGPNAGSQFALTQPVMSVGRHPASDIFLDDITVSRRHAEIHLNRGTFRVVDLGSLNSTYVNREPVDSAVLTNGDEIRIGNFRLVFLTGPLSR
jgi:pSer/pThr/pTyr-binding forkhead associated (FHA) protein